MFYRTNLKISGLMTMDSGMFQCLASNPAGNIQSSAFLNVFHAGNCKGFPFFLFISNALFERNRNFLVLKTLVMQF